MFYLLVKRCTSRRCALRQRRDFLERTADAFKHHSKQRIAQAQPPAVDFDFNENSDALKKQIRYC